MRIAILGSGLMGTALGTTWARAGHAVTFSYSRNRNKLEQIARDVGADASAAAPNEAVRRSDVVLVSVPWHRLDDALETAGGPKAFAAKTVITCSLPMRDDDADLAIGHEASGSETLASHLPGIHLVAAFNTIPSELIGPDLLRLARDERPHVLIAGDDTAAKDVAATLAGDAGFTPVDAGPLRVCRWLEPFGVLVGQLAYAQELGPALGYRFLPESDNPRFSRMTPPTPS